MSEAALAAPSAPRLPEPRGSEWTWADLQALPEGGPKTEIVEGVLTVSPKPAHRHQFAAQRLTRLLEDAAPPEWVVIAEADVELANDVFEPDIVVLAERGYGTAPLQAADVLVAVEVTSPSSRSMDKIIKPAALAAAGVPHYWRADIDATPYIEVYELDGRQYRLVRTVRSATRLERPFPIGLDPAVLVRET